MITRPALRYHGGKWRLADWIIAHFPEHKTYIEPFGGGASVLLKKQPAAFEIYNDIDSEVWNFFKVLQNKTLCCELIHRLTMTPYGRDEFDAAYEDHGLDTEEDLVEGAAKMAIRSYMGYGNKGASGRIRTGFSTSPRDKSSGNLRFDIESWNRYPESLLNVAKRLKNTLIENTDAIELMRKYDSPEALFYCDPPYLRSLRGTPNVYKFEMLEKDHRRLLEFLTECKAMVILSGYAGDLYNGFLSDWEQVTKGTHTVNAGDRIETLWISPNAVRIQKLFSYKECCQ